MDAIAQIPTERVLVADADAGLRRRVQKRLVDDNVVIDCVSDGRSAMERLREDRYGVILLDVSLPYIGLERVLELLRQTPAGERPIVLVLAEANAARSLDVDLVQIVLRKPFDLTELASLVQSCVHTAAAEREWAGDDGDTLVT